MDSFVLGIRMPPRAKYGSGRCVKMKMLSSPDYDRIQVEAAASFGKNPVTLMGLKIERQRRGILEAITHVSDPDIDPKQPMGEIAFSPVTMQQLMTPGGPMSLYALFNAREIEALYAHFDKLHEPDFQDIGGNDEGNVVSVLSS